MSFLIRVAIPDTPGSLGRLAEAFGEVGANIQSVDIVEATADHRVMDDIVVTLEQGSMIDAVITAASSIPDVEVDSIRPFSGRIDRRGQIKMLAQLAKRSHDASAALDGFMEVLPQSMTASWALILQVHDSGNVSRIAASAAAPEDDGSSPSEVAVDHARVLDPEIEKWIPQGWTILDSALAVVPLPGTHLFIVIARAGGPDFQPGEIEHLANLGTIIGYLLQK